MVKKAIKFSLGDMGRFLHSQDGVKSWKSLVEHFKITVLADEIDNDFVILRVHGRQKDITEMKKSLKGKYIEWEDLRKKEKGRK